MYLVFTSKNIYTRRIACLLSNFRSQSSDNMDEWPGVGVGTYPWNSLESQARISKPPEGDPKIICQPSDSFRCYPPSYHVFDDRTVWYDKPRAQQYTKHIQTSYNPPLLCCQSLISKLPGFPDQSRELHISPACPHGRTGWWLQPIPRIPSNFKTTTKTTSTWWLIGYIRRLQSTLHTLHSPLDALYSTLYTPQHSVLYTAHPTLHTLHSRLHSTPPILHTTLLRHYTLYISIQVGSQNGTVSTLPLKHLPSSTIIIHRLLMSIAPSPSDPSEMQYSDMTGRATPNI